MIKAVKPAKKKKGMMFDSTAQRELTICQGEIAVKNIVISANFLPSNCSLKMNINGSERMPASIIGSLTDTALIPCNATNGINI